MPRKYNKVIILEDAVFKLKDEGRTNFEIVNLLGFSDLQSLKNLIKRHNRRLRAAEEIKVSKKRGRPRKNPITGENKLRAEIARLEMENELLRNFLLEIERR